MFERFTKSAREVVEGAVGHAERAGDPTIGEEHLLLSLLDLEGTRASAALAALGVDRRREALEEALGETRRRGGVSRADAEALAGLGIDVAAIVARVEDAHGTGALAARRGPRRWRPAGRRPFTRGAKGVLERSLRPPWPGATVTSATSTSCSPSPSAPAWSRTSSPSTGRRGPTSSVCSRRTARAGPRRAERPLPAGKSVERPTATVLTLSGSTTSIMPTRRRPPPWCPDDW